MPQVPGLRDRLLYHPTSDNRILFHATQAGEASCLSKDFWEYITTNIWLPNSPDCNPFDYYVWNMVDQETNKTLCKTKDKLKARIIVAFTNSRRPSERLIGNFEIVWRLQLKQMVIFLISLIYCIVKYFHVFLLNMWKNSVIFLFALFRQSTPRSPYIYIYIYIYI